MWVSCKAPKHQPRFSQLLPSEEGTTSKGFKDLQQLERFSGLLLKGQGQNLALTVVYVPETSNSRRMIEASLEKDLVCETSDQQAGRNATLSAN